MKINYVKVSDYYIPALTVPNKRYNIGKYSAEFTVARKILLEAAKN